MQKIEDICRPFLQEYNLGHFWYARLYKDGSFIDLNNHPEWFQRVLTKGYYDLWNKLRSSSSHWPTKEVVMISTPRDFFTDISLNELNFINDFYGIFHVFNIISPRENYLENIAFTAPLKNSQALLLYSRYFGILKAFGVFFRQQYNDEIQKIEKTSRIFIPFSSLDYPLSDLPIFNHNELPSRKWLQHNLKHYSMKTIYGEIQLSTRQQQCLSLLAQGYTIKQAAQSLKISPRTFETYLSKLKNGTKLDRAALVRAFVNSGL